jgi:hypothetical protein
MRSRKARRRSGCEQEFSTDEMNPIRGKYEAIPATTEFIRTQRVKLEAEQRKTQPQRLWDSV